MRTIKFRAKTPHLSKWLYGNLITSDDFEVAIIRDVESCTEQRVDADTVGQFTGLCDDNGHEIYEGDVLKVEDSDYYCFVRWDIDFAAFVAVRFQHGSHLYCGYTMLDELPSDTQLCVIGNIHDNPELIK
jgi:uncharacterized phage protein (TIGR01671 family)